MYLWWWGVRDVNGETSKYSRRLLPTVSCRLKQKEPTRPAKKK